MRRFLSCLLFFTLVVPAAAQVLPGEPAAPDTPEALVGEAVLYFVNGRTREEAGGDDVNPFGMDADALLFHVGAFFVVTGFEGEALKEGDLALYPAYAMPRGAGTPSAETPPIIPFALMQQGVCHGGYVAGYPVPDAVYTLDMTGALCHADTVEQIVHDAYQAAAPVEQPPTDDTSAAGPVFPTDAELQSAVYAAYDAAYALALNSPEYYFWDGTDFTPTHDAVVRALADQGLAGITVATDPAADPKSAKACAAPGTAELRIAFTPDRLGVTVAAATASRVYAYDYDYAISPDLRVTEPRDCATSGPGRAGSRSY